MSEPEVAPSGFEDLARTALLEVTDARSVGPLVSESDEGDGVVSLRFESNLPGYLGWKWTVSVAKIGDAEPTVLESELMPGDGALLAPEWVPWSDRLDEYNAGRAAARAEADDEDADDDLVDDEDLIDEEDLVDDDLGDDEYDGVDIDTALEQSEDDVIDDAEDTDDDVIDDAEDTDDEDARGAEADAEDEDEDEDEDEGDADAPARAGDDDLVSDAEDTDDDELRRDEGESEGQADADAPVAQDSADDLIHDAEDSDDADVVRGAVGSAGPGSGAAAVGVEQPE